jgi:hypothetical protein
MIQIYYNGLALSLPILTCGGVFCGFEIILDKEYEKHSNIIGNTLTVLGGGSLGALCSIIYPLIFVISPIKFLYDYNKIYGKLTTIKV